MQPEARATRKAAGRGRTCGRKVAQGTSIIRDAIEAAIGQLAD